MPESCLVIFSQVVKSITQWVGWGVLGGVRVGHVRVLFVVMLVRGEKPLSLGNWLAMS